MTHNEFEAMVQAYGQEKQVFMPSLIALNAWLDHAGKACRKCDRAWYFKSGKDKLTTEQKQKVIKEGQEWARFTCLLAVVLLNCEGVTTNLPFGPHLTRCQKKEIFQRRYRVRPAKTTSGRKPLR